MVATIASVRTRRVAPRWLFVEVTSDDGMTGWGEAIVPKRARAVTGAVDDLAANLFGAPIGRIREAALRMRTGAFFRGGPVLATAAAAIEQALWDIHGRRHDSPVHVLLGGPVRDRIRAYAWIGGDRPADVAAHARARVEAGYTAVKMNATAETDHLDSAAIDGLVDRISAVRDAAGAQVGIAVDLHGRVHRAMLRSVMRVLDDLDVLWVEEPVPPGHDDVLRDALRGCSGPPIATGERVVSRWGFRHLLEHRVVDVLQPDVSLTGITELVTIAAMAEAYDVAVAPHCPNGPVSLAATLQAAACAPNVVIQEHSAGIHYHQGYVGLDAADLEDYLVDPAPVTAHDGHLIVPDGPGLGIEVDATAVEAGERDWVLPDPVWRLPDGRIAEW